MNTAFLLMAQYNTAVVPIEAVCRDYFQHMRPEQFIRQATAGRIALPLIQIDATSAKSARGVHISDLAAWIDERRAAALKECKLLTGAG